MKNFRLLIADQFLRPDDLAFTALLWERLALGLWTVGLALGLGVIVTWWMGP